MHCRQLSLKTRLPQGSLYIIFLQYCATHCKAVTIYLLICRKNCSWPIYIYLLESRYGNNLKILTEVPKDYWNKKILPLTIQLLIENAIKHNEISKQNPLRIHISVEKNHRLKIVNKLQCRINPESSLGIGLSNLLKRYRMVADQDVVILNNNSQFIVEVPIITL